MLLFAVAIHLSAISTYADCDGGKLAGARDIGFGPNPYAVVSGDFNSDGKMDVAAADFTSNTARIAFGDGTGDFSSAANFPTGLKSVDIAVGDLNNDGKLDLVVSNYEGNNVSVLLGNGLGNFTITNFNAGVSPKSVALADFNSDTKIDVAVTNPSFSSILILLNNGTGGLLAPTTIQLTNGRVPNDIVAADFNNDTKADFATLNQGGVTGGGDVTTFVGTGSGTFATPVITSSMTDPLTVTTSLVAGQFNNDGVTDLVVAGFTPARIRILIGNNAGGFTLDNLSLNTNGSNYGVQLADINGDSKLDIAVVSSDVPAKIFFGDGLGGVSGSQDLVVGSEARSLTVADFNGDNKADVVTSYGNSLGAGLSIALNDGAGRIESLSFLGANSGPPLLADLNFDGRLDLVIPAGNVYVRLGLPNGDFASPVSYSTSGSSHLAVGDFNNDGRLDIAAASSQNVSVLINNGSGGFGSAAVYPAGSTVRAIVVGQFTNDNNLDLAVAAYDARVVRVFTGNGSGGFGITGSFPVSANPFAIVSGDFNNDGKLDVITANRCVTGGGQCNNYKFTLFLGNGNGGFGTPLDLFQYLPQNDTNFLPQLLASADLNGDGKLDLVFASGAGTHYAINDGAGNFTAYSLYPSAVDSVVASVGDLNDDGRPDIVLSGGSVSRQIRVFVNNGDGSFGPAVFYSAFYIQLGLAIGDTNADGKRDIVFAANSGIYRLLGKCALTRGAHTSDFDGDGITDISVFRPSTGFWYIINSSDGSFHYVPFGTNGDIPVPGDYDGDGKSDVAVFRPSNGTWYYLRSSDGSFQFQQFGTSGDIPVPGDFDGNGISNFAVWRPSTGYWYTSTNPAINYGAVLWGQNGDTPVPADYDGDGRTDIAVFRPSSATWYLLRSAQGYQEQVFGISSDVPVPADYDGDGRANFAVFRASTGFWYTSTNPAINYGAIPLGQSGDIPAAGYYDRDGNADAAVFRAGDWYIFQSTTATVAGTHFGAAGDVPVPAKAVP